MKCAESASVRRQMCAELASGRYGIRVVVEAASPVAALVNTEAVRGAEFAAVVPQRREALVLLTLYYARVHTVLEEVVAKRTTDPHTITKQQI